MQNAHLVLVYLVKSKTLIFCFILLVHIYFQVCVIISAEASPDDLFVTGALSESDQHDARVLMADLNITIVSVV